MDGNSNIPIYSSLALPQCRYIISWTIPFAFMVSTPLCLVFSYYNTQNQKHFKKWNVKLLGKDLLLFWGAFALYATGRTLFLDPYCNPKSVHYDKSLNAFEKKKMVVESMRKVLEAEGKSTKPQDSQE